ncbi:MAG: tetratricopeptide repeat protein [Sphingomicrobium sp.]
MTSTLRFGTAISAALLATALGGCAVHAPRYASAAPAKVDDANVGLATRAQAALMAGNAAEAISFAERAVDVNPSEAGFRTLLGNSYFAGGRFASAEAAYRDSLTIQSNQPQVVLKLALVSIAQGKNGQALSFLDAARPVLDPSDYGLAMALAGRPQDAAEVLRRAAEQVGADSRVRQNLALALALSGDWTGARSVAAQDISPDQLDARIQSWMAMAHPSRASDQVASLTGIAPAASDPGQPLRLALKDAATRLAAVTPTVEPAPVEMAAPMAQAPAPVAIAAAAPAATPVHAAPVPPALQIAEVLSPPLYVASLTPKPAASAPRPSLSPRAAALTDVRAVYRRAMLSTGQQRSRAVVQLGAYATRGAVTAGWRHSSGKFAALRGYTPVAARYDGERGTVFRLSVQGFSTARQAIDLCGSLKRAGAACFVRNFAGDAPVQLASR